jgi:hypothetical protein
MTVPTVTPPKYTKQVMVLLEPDTSGEVYAWAEQISISGSATCREIIAAGLAVMRDKWVAAGIEPPTKKRIEQLRAEHRRQGDEQTARRRGDDAERRKPSG